MDMNIPDSIPGVKDALLKHMMENAEKFGANESSVKALWKEVKRIQKHEEEEEQKGVKMADTIVTPSGDNAALMALLARGGGNDGMFRGNGLIGGLILGSLLHNNGNLFGGFE